MCLAVIWPMTTLLVGTSGLTDELSVLVPTAVLVIGAVCIELLL
jgi:hypothetical protein